MKSFLSRLERLVDIMDNELNQPISRVLTGEVFTHDPSARTHGIPEQQPTPQAPRVLPASKPTREARPVDTVPNCGPRLRPVGAHKK